MKNTVAKHYRSLLILIGVISALSISWYSIDEKSKFEAKAVRIIDGDTFVITQEGQEVKIRLYGVDCPELDQSYGKMAKIYSESFLMGQDVSIEIVDKDKYGRMVCMVYVGSACLNEHLLKEGLAWHYTFFDRSKNFTRWSSIQDSCMFHHVGIWSDPDPIEPQIFRRKGRIYH